MTDENNTHDPFGLHVQVDVAQDDASIDDVQQDQQDSFDEPQQEGDAGESLDDEQMQESDQDDVGATLEEDEQEEKPAPKRGRNAESRIRQLASQKRELANEVEQLKAQMQNLMQGIDMLNPNQAQQEKDASDKLRDVGINPDMYETDAERMLALQNHETNVKLSSLQQQQELNSVKNEIVNSINDFVKNDAKNGETVKTAYQTVINSEARRFMTAGINDRQAIAMAERQVMAWAAQQSDPTLAVVKHGLALMDVLGVQVKPLQNKQQPATIDMKNRAESKKRAGRPNVQSSASSQKPIMKGSDYMMTHWS